MTILNKTSAHQWWTVFVLTLVMLVSFIDRQIISLLIEPMKADLHLNDAQAGLLYSGFSLFYALAGIPLASLIDKGNRKKILSICLTLWTIFTMAGGVLHSFWSLFLSRVGVGIGEASVTPAAHSIIGDTMPKHSIPLAITIFQSGAILGTGLAFILGGFVVSLVRHANPIELPLFGLVYAWQLSFIIVALPGFFVLLLLNTISEPRRTSNESTMQNDVLQISLQDFYKGHWKTIISHHAGFAFLVLMGHAFVFWTPSFFERVHGVPAEDAAVVYGLIFIIAGAIAAISSAKLAQIWMARGSRESLVNIAMLGALGFIISVGLLQFAQNASEAFALYVPALFFLNVPFGLGFAALPLIAPAHIRGRVAAIYMLTLSIGNAIGPPLTGYLSEYVFTNNVGLIQALTTVTTGFGIAGIAFLLAGKKYFGESIFKQNND